MLNKIARLVGAFFITLVVLLLMLFIVLTAMEYRPESTEKVRIDSLAEDTFDSPEVGSTIKVMSWNIGYGALGDNADFFMDGGSQVTTASAERVQENMQGIIDELKSEKADVMFLQEVDRFSTRAHHIDEQQDIAESMDGYQNTFANNFKVRYVPYPWPPIGRVDSGIMTLSRFAQSDSTRISLPCPFEWPVRIANLKRCLMVNRVPIAGTKKELVMINLHLEAYDNGEGKVKQTRALLKVMKEEQKKGNYVIAGGDFNQTFSNVDIGKYPSSEAIWTPGKIDAKDLEPPDGQQQSDLPFPGQGLQDRGQKGLLLLHAGRFYPVQESAGGFHKNRESQLQEFRPQPGNSESHIELAERKKRRPKGRRRVYAYSENFFSSKSSGLMS